MKYHNKLEHRVFKKNLKPVCQRLRTRLVLTDCLPSSPEDLLAILFTSLGDVNVPLKDCQILNKTKLFTNFCRARAEQGDKGQEGRGAELKLSNYLWHDIAGDHKRLTLTRDSISRETI